MPGPFLTCLTWYVHTACVESVAFDIRARTQYCKNSRVIECKAGTRIGGRSYRRVKQIRHIALPLNWSSNLDNEFRKIRKKRGAHTCAINLLYAEPRQILIYFRLRKMHCCSVREKARQKMLHFIFCQQNTVCFLSTKIQNQTGKWNGLDGTFLEC